MFWTNEKVQLLKELLAEGISSTQIEHALGGADHVDVISETRRLGRPASAKRVPSNAENISEAEDEPIWTIRDRHSVKTRHPLAIHLTIYNLERLVRELLPFYGVDCAIAVVYSAYDRDGPVIRGTLSTIEYAIVDEPSGRSMLVLVG